MEPFPPPSRTGQIAIKSWPQLGQNQKLTESQQLPQNKYSDKLLSDMIAIYVDICSFQIQSK